MPRKDEADRLRRFAHDIRGVLACAQLALDGLQTGGRATRRKAERNLQRAIDRATEYCSAEVQRHSKDKLLGAGDTALADLISDLGALHADKATRLKVELLARCDGSRISAAKEAALHRLLSNLTANALHAQAAQAGGRVEIVARQGAGGLLIDIVDHGPGLPAAIERYVRGGARLDHPSAPPRGLGLASAFALAGELGGNLTLISSSPSGVVFRVALPNSGPEGLKLIKGGAAA